MQEMIELSKQQTNLPVTEAKAVRYSIEGAAESKVVYAGPAQFGRELGKGFSVSGQLVVADPIKACTAPNNAKEFWGKIVIVERGDCMFVGKINLMNMLNCNNGVASSAEKARVLEKAGAKGGIVVDNNKGSTSANSPLFSMSGDGVDDVSIPMIFVFSNDAKPLFEAIQAQVKVEATLLDSSGKQC